MENLPKPSLFKREAINGKHMIVGHPEAVKKNLYFHAEWKIII